MFRDSGRTGFIAEPVACWLLVSHPADATRSGQDERHVHPGVAMGSVIDDATHADTYLFVVDPFVDNNTIKKMITDFDDGEVIDEKKAKTK